MLKRPINILVLLFMGVSVAGAAELPRVNLAHLLSLVQTVQLNGRSVKVIDVYADYPSYKPVDAKGEGFACVDDAARAAVLLIRYNEVFHKHANENVIEGLTRFVIGMQTKDGLFYNFVQRRNGKVVINEKGRTSVASFGWWAARAVWALGSVAAYVKESNRPLYREIIAAVNKSMPQVESLVRKSGKLDKAGNPAWLLYGDGADATSELVLGLNEMYKATGDARFASMSRTFCKGMSAMQKGGCGEMPYGMIPSNGDGWHAWAGSQAEAIIQYTRLTHDSSMVRVALDEIDCFLPRWAGALFFRSCNMSGGRLDYSGQIAYDIGPATCAAAEAYEYTHERKYATLAAIISSWLLGNNTAKVDFYYEKTGICFDGSVDSLQVNKNSGAESTIEALMSLVAAHEVQANPKGIELISNPSFEANEYHYRVDGNELRLVMGPLGFEIR